MISVIVPVYKVEAYLDRCVRSIVEQTYEDLEIILVDDGSPDNCGVMCDAWAAKDGRVRVVHKPNGGLSDARNTGLAIASGEYISFVDSDDWLASDFYRVMIQTMHEQDCDIVSCGYLPTSESEKDTLMSVDTIREATDGIPPTSLMIIIPWENAIATFFVFTIR